MATPLIFIDVLATPQSNWQWNSLAPSANLFGGQQLSTGAVNATISFNFYAASGTYTVDLFNLANTDGGIYTVQADGATLGTIDGWAASAASRKSSLTGLVITTTGVHLLTIVMLTKNASSTAYRGVLNAISLTKTA